MQLDADASLAWRVGRLALLSICTSAECQIWLAASRKAAAGKAASNAPESACGYCTRAAKVRILLNLIVLKMNARTACERRMLPRGRSKLIGGRSLTPTDSRPGHFPMRRFQTFDSSTDDMSRTREKVCSGILDHRQHPKVAPASPKTLNPRAFPDQRLSTLTRTPWPVKFHQTSRSEASPRSLSEALSLVHMPLPSAPQRGWTLHRGSVQHDCVEGSYFGRLRTSMDASQST